MKKVLFTATVDSHILQFHLPYLKWFKEQGYEVHVATNGDEKIPYCDVKHKITFERSPMKINNIKAIFKLKKIIEKEKFQIIHTHTPMGSVVTRLAAKKARKKYKTRVIYTAHGFHFFKGAPLINWIVFYPIEKYLSKYTDCLITINEEDYNLAKAKFKAKKIELVNGVGVDENRFDFKMSDEEKHELRQSLGLKDDDFVIIYVAELINRKNHYMILNTMNKIHNNQNIKLLLVGNGDLKEEYTKYIKENKLEKNVRMLGYRKDVPQLMKISNIAISTSKQEGLPVNVMEAMISELPDIVTNCRGNRDLIKNGKNGYVIEQDDESTLYKRIMDLYKNKDLRDKMGYQSKKMIESFELERVIKELTDIYNEVIL